jgi:hypothetical protein
MCNQNFVFYDVVNELSRESREEMKEIRTEYPEEFKAVRDDINSYNWVPNKDRGDRNEMAWQDIFVWSHK